MRNKHNVVLHAAMEWHPFEQVKTTSYLVSLSRLDSSCICDAKSALEERKNKGKVLALKKRREEYEFIILKKRWIISGFLVKK